MYLTLFNVNYFYQEVCNFTNETITLQVQRENVPSLRRIALFEMKKITKYDSSKVLSLNMPQDLKSELLEMIREELFFVNLQFNGYFVQPML